MSGAQLSLLASRCKAKGCDEPVVGWSLRDDGSVCRRHNEMEWSRALARSPERWHQQLAKKLRQDAIA